MGYYNYLCELLRPLRVYRLDEGSLSGAELYAAGEGLDAAAEALEKAAREGVLMTAEDEGLSRRERLFSRVGARTTPALRRLAIASLLRVGGDGFSLEAVNQAIRGCGARAAAAAAASAGASGPTCGISRYPTPTTTNPFFISPSGTARLPPVRPPPRNHTTSGASSASGGQATSRRHIRRA